MQSELVGSAILNCLATKRLLLQPAVAPRGSLGTFAPSPGLLSFQSPAVWNGTPCLTASCEFGSPVYVGLPSSRQGVGSCGESLCGLAPRTHFLHPKLDYGGWLC